MYINRKTGELVEAEWVEKVSAWNVNDGFGITIALLSTATFNAQYGLAMICPVDKRDCGLLCKGEHCGIHPKLIDCGITCEDKKYLCIPYIPEEYDVDNEPVFPICGTCNAQKEQMKKLDPLPRFDKVFEEGYANMCEEEQTSQIIARATKEVEELISIGEKMTEQKEPPSIGGILYNPPVIEQSNLMLSDEEIRKIFSQIEDVLIDSGLVLNDIMPELRKVAQAELDHLKGLGIVYVKKVDKIDKCPYGCEENCTATSPDDCGDRAECEPYIVTSYITLSEYRKENEK